MKIIFFNDYKSNNYKTQLNVADSMQCLQLLCITNEIKLLVTISTNLTYNIALTYFRSHCEVNKSGPPGENGFKIQVLLSMRPH